LAAVAGMLFLMYYGLIDFFIGFLAGIKAFTAAVLGGIGSLPGAMLGGLLIGLIEVVLVRLFLGRVQGCRDLRESWCSVLIFRPTGCSANRRSRRSDGEVRVCTTEGRGAHRWWRPALGIFIVGFAPYDVGTRPDCSTTSSRLAVPSGQSSSAGSASLAADGALAGDRAGAVMARVGASPLKLPSTFCTGSWAGRPAASFRSHLAVGQQAMASGAPPRGKALGSTAPSGSAPSCWPRRSSCRSRRSPTRRRWTSPS
jgi:hypothetical protein